MKYSLKSFPLHIALFVILSCILAGISVSNALILKLIMDFSTNKTERMSYLLLVLVVIGYILINAVFYYFQQYNSDYLAKKSVFLYRNIIFKRIVQSSLSHYTKKDLGEYISLMTSQMDKLEQNYFVSIYWGSYLLIQFVIACIVAFFMNPFMALIAIILSIPNVFIPIVFKKILERTTLATINSTNTFISKITDYLKGFVDWKINGNGQLISKLENKASKQLLSNQKEEVKANNIATVFNNSFSNVLYLGTWLVGAFFIINKNLTVGSIVAFSQLITNISFPIYSFSDLFSQIMSGRKLFQQIENQFPENEDDDALVSVGPFKDIQFKDVKVNLKDNKTISFKHLKFTNGKKYLIEGPSGSGKTTIFRLITKQLIDYQGTITFNGTNLQDINNQSLFDQIAYLPQDGHIFNTSLLNNLTLYSQDYEQQNLVDVLKFVGLEKWATSEYLNMSIDSKKVSGGEAKRIELARLLLQKKQILVLDEFSSGIDESMLKMIEGRLFKLPVTILYISHVVNDDLLQKADDLITLK
ncbi:ATP-binding cassette domain-containing protein [Lactobacillus helveticus]|uniref:ABC transporter ATP-binding protein n=3 Tax=Lactobacillus helveticus TaxID=1587 RepID=A0AAV4E447_LACHE|nr:ABC transporter ATP-binding protein [Lactobacillus helveticus]ABX27147.1 ABC transporter ATP-binding permease [Lactobacillus helveticus DPC 4571]AUI76301.1 ABC transporter ATP-binding protein [Lactobacillus helveticus]KXN79838.1 ABC transporter ATP-binding protein [Lactobacillus helveticus]MBO1882594.1 ABC transporter ATP-binding protein [Lactobacillus helveticus]MBW7980540.1 ABC transporter ATP-binding protein [Lactobacillus helveticus]